MASSLAGRALRRTVSQQRAFSAQNVRAMSSLNTPVTHLDTLSSGLRVASQNSGGDTATVGVWIDAGSRYENENTNGTAHFLEHMAFKGTQRRTQHQLEEEVENLGGHLNAYTSREQTVYYAKVAKKDVPQAMDILSDILLNSTLTSDQVDRERDVILRELEEVENIPEEVVFDRLHETAFQGTSLARTILGPPKNIQSITNGMLKEYIDTHYIAPRMVVAGAGAIEQGELCELSEKFFGNVSKESKGAPIVKEPSRFVGSEIRERDDDSPTTHLAIAVQGAAWTHPDSVPLMVAQSLLGMWDKSQTHGSLASSRMVSKVAEQGHASSVMAFNTCYSDTGLFGVHAVAGNEGLDDLAWELEYEMVRMCFEATDGEVARARNQLKVNLLGHMDGTTAVCEDIGRQVLTYGRRITPAEMCARIDAVDAATLRNVAHKYIHDQEIAVAAIGPVSSLPDYNWLRRRVHWLRY